jgi:hypothetical protein
MQNKTNSFSLEEVFQLAEMVGDWKHGWTVPSGRIVYGVHSYEGSIKDLNIKIRVTKGNNIIRGDDYKILIQGYNDERFVLAEYHGRDDPIIRKIYENIELKCNQKSQEKKDDILRRARGLLKIKKQSLF